MSIYIYSKYLPVPSLFLFFIFSLLYNVLLRDHLFLLMSLPTKRSATATATPSSSSASATSNFPPMKKAKSQAVSACSPLDHSCNKNGIHHFSSGTTADNDVVFDPSSMTLDDDPKLQDFSPPAAANLSRKKATPPQPAKKLVIKLVKGTIFFFLNCCLALMINLICSLHAVSFS